MRPTKLTISAFGPFADKQELDLNALGEKGIYLITGDTGAGKTTIFDAITYALFGAPSGDVREVSMLRSHYADKDTPTKVTLEFTHRGRNYSITRLPAQLRPAKRVVKGKEEVMAPPTVSLTLPDGTELTADKDVSSKIEDILGVDRGQFNQIAMIAQGKFQELLLADTDSRLEIFREIFKTQRFELFEKLVQKEYSRIDKEYDRIKNSLAQYVSGIRRSEQSPLFPQLTLSQKGQTPLENVAVLLKNIISEETEQERVANEQITAKETEISKLTAHIATAKNQEKAREAIVADEARIKELEPHEQELAKTAEKVRNDNTSQITDKQQKIGKIKQTLPSYDQLASLKTQVATSQTEIHTLAGNIKTAEKALQDSRNELQTLKNEFQALADSSADERRKEVIGRTPK